MMSAYEDLFSCYVNELDLDCEWSHVSINQKA